MGPQDGAARVPCWQRQHRASGFEEPGRRPSWLAKDVLGATVTLAVVGVYLLQVTNALASRCGAGLKPHAGLGACTGVSALASHFHVLVAVCVGVCAALAVATFIWYMFWGYKVNRRVGTNPDTADF
jgi:ABC-type uncharacterized transport system permease subunit